MSLTYNNDASTKNKEKTNKSQNTQQSTTNENNNGNYKNYTNMTVIYQNKFKLNIFVIITDFDFQCGIATPR